MTFKKISGWLHLWLGLIAGLIVMIIALTGAIYTFQPELTKATQPYLSVKAENRPFLPASAFKSIAEKQLPGKKPIRIMLRGKDESVNVMFFERKQHPYYYNVYINPYSGKVLAVKNMYRDFFYVTLLGHLYLWLPQPIGHVVNIYGTLTFLVIIISGIVLWWPRNKARRKTSFKVKWDASPKRLNYDLHNVLGFYASWIILFAVLTGLVWGFEWAAKAEYSLLSGGKSKPVFPKTKVLPVAQPVKDPLDKITAIVQAQNPGAKRVMLMLPATDSAAVGVRIYNDEQLNYTTDLAYFNPYTLEEIKVPHWGKYSEATIADKAVRMNYDIHVGAIAGWPGRILMFLASLITASLPVTGFYIWWGKRKKDKKKSKGAAKKAGSVQVAYATPKAGVKA